jgi:UDP-N-acetylmuramoyl-L-alanyl-D-glutamate--2,6-diaminopimelate ligase
MQQLLESAGGVRLREILPQGQFFGGSDIRVHSCCGDWRSIQPGDAFIALVDRDGDGHDEVARAVQRGATAIVAERFLPVRVPMCVVPDTREAYGRICQRLAGQPDHSMRLIGVTGTHGKTSTSLLIARVLEAAENYVGATTSLGYFDAACSRAATRTTPGPPELADWLARMVGNGCSHAVVEVSSESLACRHTAGLEFDAAVLTNIRREHLDLHGNVQNYRRAKRRLFQQLKPNGFAVVNVDDPTTRSLIPQLDVPQITVGMHADATLQAQVIDRCPSEQTFLLSAGQETVPVRTRTIGDQYVYFCLAAAAVGLVMGIDLTTVVQGIESLENVPGRLERLECGQTFGVFVDCAHTPDALAISLATLRQVTAGRLICVYGAAHGTSGDTRASLGRVVERSADLNIITSNDPLHEEPLQISHDILDGYRKPGRAHVIPDRAKAIHWALREANPGDVVLLAGKGERDTQLLSDGPIAFDDRQVARDCLYGLPPQQSYNGTPATIPFTPRCHWN